MNYPIKISSEKLRELVKKDSYQAAELCRLMIAYNVFTTLYDLYLFSVDNNKTLGQRKEFDRGHRDVQYFLTVGVLKEALDAFRQVNKNKALLNRKTLNQNEEFNKARAELERISSEKDPKSFYRKYIEPVRQDAAFHWDVGLIRNCLERMCPKGIDSWPILLVSYSSKNIDLRFPVGDELLENLQPRVYTLRRMVSNAKTVAKTVRYLRIFTEAVIETHLIPYTLRWEHISQEVIRSDSSL